MTGGIKEEKRTTDSETSIVVTEEETPCLHSEGNCNYGYSANSLRRGGDNRQNNFSSFNGGRRGMCYDYEEENLHVTACRFFTERMMLQEDSVVTTVHLVLACVTYQNGNCNMVTPKFDRV